MTPPHATASPATTAPLQLERRLSAYDAAAVVVSNVIGSGILFMPAIVAGMVGNPGAMLAVWLGGGILAFAGAMAYAELAALRPKSGGEYVYLKEAFGPLAAFLTGWTSFVAGFSGAIAATSVGLAGFLGRFFPAAGDATPWATLPLGLVTLSLSPQSVVALTAILGLSLVHILGIGPGRLVQNALALVKVCALLIFVAAGLSIGHGSTAHFSGGAPWVPSGMLLALIPVMFSYSGWNAAAYLAEEVKDPTRNVPRALAMGTIAVVLVYVAMNVVYLYALDVTAMSAVKVRIVDAAAEALFGPRVADVLTVVSIFIVLGSISANIFAGPRVYYAMARDGLFPEGRGARQPAHAHAGIRDRGASGVERGARAHGDVRAARHVHRLRGGPVCRHRRARAVRVAASRTGCTAAVPRAGLPGRAGSVRGGERRDGDQRHLARAAAVARRHGDPRRRHPGLLALPAPSVGRAARRSGRLVPG